MRIVYGDVWGYPADYICIPTNGSVRRDGQAVMGRGVAAQAKQRHPEVAGQLGMLLQQYRQDVSWLGQYEGHGLLSFPVKITWRMQASLSLIEESARQLAVFAYAAPHCIFVLPRPGCGNGQRSWEEVRPVIEPILPDNVHVIDLAQGEPCWRVLAALGNREELEGEVHDE